MPNLTENVKVLILSKLEEFFQISRLEYPFRPEH
jgi:hypothetical protein